MSSPTAPNDWKESRLIHRPVYAGDIARAVEICCRDDQQVIDAVGGRVIEAGGPEGMSFSLPLIASKAERDLKSRV